METSVKTQSLATPNRLEAFAMFFKNYMGAFALITASLPIPVTQLKLIPTFKQQTGILTVYTSLFCFLLLGYVFYSRHIIAKAFFPGYFLNQKKRLVSSPVEGLRIHLYISEFPQKTFALFINLLPLLFIAFSVYSAFLYYEALNASLNNIRQTMVTTSPGRYSFPLFNMDSVTYIKQKVDQLFILDNFQVSSDVPLSQKHILYYLGVFLFAEAAFILMAIKEYMQDLLGLTDKVLIEGEKFEPAIRQPLAKE